jgi:hypothetical protein
VRVQRASSRWYYERYKMPRLPSSHCSRHLVTYYCLASQLMAYRYHQTMLLLTKGSYGCNSGFLYKQARVESRNNLNVRHKSLVFIFSVPIFVSYCQNLDINLNCTKNEKNKSIYIEPKGGGRSCRVVKGAA